METSSLARSRGFRVGSFPRWGQAPTSSSPTYPFRFFKSPMIKVTAGIRTNSSVAGTGLESEQKPDLLASAYGTGF